jgi:hypothetical protein
VWTTPYMLAATGGEPQRVPELFGVSGAEAGHYNAWGNRVAFEALRQGILAPAAAPDLARVYELCASGARIALSRTTRAVEILGVNARLSAHTRAACIRFLRAAPDQARGDLWLRAGADGPTTLELELGGNFRRLVARAERVLEEPSTCVEGALRVSIEVDGAQQAGWTMGEQGADPQAAAAWPIELALERAGRLRIVLGSAGAGEACGWIVLRGLRLE